MAGWQYTDPPVPVVVAGAMTVKCECGWEAVFIQPEEHVQMLQVIFGHFKDHHQIETPVICCFWH